MSEFRQALTCCLFSFRQWRGNMRVLLAFALAFILCFFLTERAASVARRYDTFLQILEPFVWTFGDGTNILLASLLLVFLLGDVPQLSAGTPFFLMRTTRRAWLLGQVLYLLGGTAVYLLFIQLSTCLLCAPVAFAGDQWSEAAALLGYAGLGSRSGIPADTTTLEMSRPAECTAVTFLLMLCYMVVLGLLVLSVNLQLGRSWSLGAVVAFSLWGLLLEPALFMRLLRLPEGMAYRANVLTGWFSPLNQATFPLHSFGYNALPRIWQSIALFAAGAALLYLAALRAVRRYQFQFTGAEP